MKHTANEIMLLFILGLVLTIVAALYNNYLSLAVGYLIWGYTFGCEMKTGKEK